MRIGQTNISTLPGHPSLAPRMSGRQRPADGLDCLSASKPPDALPKVVERTRLAPSGVHGVRRDSTALGGVPDDAFDARLSLVPLPQLARQKAATLSLCQQEEVDRYAIKAEQPGGDAVADTWLRVFLSVPDTVRPPRQVGYDAAISELDAKLYGQSKAKQILAAELNWAQATGAQRFKVMLVGPPGVGKTTLLQALGETFGRPVVTIRVDQLSEASGLLGLAPSYQAVTTGAILDAVVRSGCKNPIIFLDELDKIRDDEKGDGLRYALNGILDDTQPSFLNQYLNLPIDLSQVAFVSAVNSVDSLRRHAWLRERVGVAVAMAGYSSEEKARILNTFTIPAINAQLRDRAFALTPDGEAKILELHEHHCGPVSGMRVLQDWVQFLARMALAQERREPLDAAFVTKTLSLLSDS